MPASVSTSPVIAVVVVLPCAPAMATPRRVAIRSAEELAAQDHGDPAALRFLHFRVRQLHR
jgi:hypothetical protein